MSNDRNSDKKGNLVLRTLQRTAVTVAATAALALGLPATQASAIDAVPCDGRDDFLKISWPVMGYVIDSCFANAGYMDAKLNKPVALSSGNNAGLVIVEKNELMQTFYFDKWQTRDLSGVSYTYGVYIH